MKRQRLKEGPRPSFRMEGPCAGHNSPEYLALQEKFPDIIKAIEGNIPEVVPNFRARDLVSQDNADAAINAVAAGRTVSVIAQQLMQPVEKKIELAPSSFYELVDVFNACQLPVAIGKILEDNCGELAK